MNLSVTQGDPRHPICVLCCRRAGFIPEVPLRADDARSLRIRHQSGPAYPQMSISKTVQLCGGEG